jgi:hypothetical protein
VDGFVSASVTETVGRVGRFVAGNGGRPFRRDVLGEDLSRAMEQWELIRQNSDGTLRFLPGVEKLLAERVKRQTLLGDRILWVDDHPANNAITQSYFTSLGATISLALTTKEAIGFSAHFLLEGAMAGVFAGQIEGRSGERFTVLQFRGF